MLLGWIRFVFLLILEIPVILLGLLINAIAIPFRYEDRSHLNDGQPRTYTKYPEHGTWKRIRLPRWALWWDNPYDGLLGDKRGWWANRCRESDRTEYNFLSMYIWSALRNPANYFSRKVTGCDVSDCVIKRVAGNVDYVNRYIVKDTTHWQVLDAVDSKGRHYPRLMTLIPWSKKYCIEINIGWKLELKQNGRPKDGDEQDRLIGNTIRVKFFVEKGNI